MPNAARGSPSNATDGSDHSSAIMIIPEPFEYNHTPLSRMGTPVSGMETPDSNSTIRPNSCNQVVRAPLGPLSVVPGNTSQNGSNNRVAPYQYVPSEASTTSSRQPSRSEYGGGYSNALRWAIDQCREQRDDRSRKCITSHSTAQPPQRQTRPTDERRSSSGWVAPIAVLGAATLLANIRISDSSHSRPTDRDRDHACRASRRHRALACDEDDDDDYYPAARSSRDRDHARNGNSRSHRSRRPRDHDRYEDPQNSGR